MSAEMLALFGGIVFLASFVQGVSGFAFGMIVLIVLPYLFSYTTALALTSMMTVVLLLYNSFLYRKHCAWKWIPLGLAAFAVGDICGVLVLRVVGDAPVWYILMGIMLIFMAAYLWWGQKRVTFTATNRNWVIFACTSGFVVGAFIVGLPILATFFSAGHEEQGRISWYDADVFAVHCGLRYDRACGKWNGNGGSADVHCDQPCFHYCWAACCALSGSENER